MREAFEKWWEGEWGPGTTFRYKSLESKRDAAEHAYEAGYRQGIEDAAKKCEAIEERNRAEWAAMFTPPADCAREIRELVK